MPVFTDYNLQNNLTPAAAAAGGMIAGQQIQRQAREFEAWDAKQQYDQQFRQDIAALGQSRPSPQDYFGLMTKYPDKAQALTAQYEMLDSQQRENMLSNVMPIYAAAYNGQHGLAAQLAEQRAQAAENSGDVGTAQSLRQSAALLKQHPEMATGLMGTTIARAVGPEKIKGILEALNAPAAAADRGLDAGTKMVDYERKLFDLQQSRQEAPNKAEANRLDIEIKRLQYEEGPRKAVYDMASQELGLENQRADIRAKNATAAQQSKYGISPEISKITMPMYQTADQQDAVAAKLKGLSARWKENFSAGAKLQGGVLSVVNETLKNWAGRDTVEGRIRRETEDALNDDLLNRLQQLKGPSSEKEMAQLRKPMPSTTDDPGLIIDYLERRANLAQEVANMERTRAQWIESFGTAGPSRVDGEVEGIQIPKGTSFMDFMKHKAKFGAGQSGAARSYDKYRNFGQ